MVGMIELVENPLRSKQQVNGVSRRGVFGNTWRVDTQPIKEKSKGNAKTEREKRKHA